MNLIELAATLKVDFDGSWKNVTQPSGGQTLEWVPAPLKGTDMVKEYDDNEGSPVWYIP